MCNYTFSHTQTGMCGEMSEWKWCAHKQFCTWVALCKGISTIARNQTCTPPWSSNHVKCCPHQDKKMKKMARGDTWVRTPIWLSTHQETLRAIWFLCGPKPENRENQIFSSTRKQRVSAVGMQSDPCSVKEKKKLRMRRRSTTFKVGDNYWLCSSFPHCAWMHFWGTCLEENRWWDNIEAPDNI